MQADADNNKYLNILLLLLLLYYFLLYSNSLGFISTKHRGEQTCKYVQSTFRRRSGLHKHNTWSRLSINTHTHTHARRKTSEYLLWSPLTPPTPPSRRAPSHLDLSSPRPRRASTQSPAVPEHPPSSLPPPNTSPVGGVMSGFCGGLLLDRSRQSACL